MSHSRNQPLRVTTFGMSKQAINTLQLFFHGPCGDKYALTDNEQADICLFDLDGVNGHEQWLLAQRQYPGRPTIVQSINDMTPEGAIYLRKPVDPEQLKKALLEVVAVKNSSKPVARDKNTESKRGMSSSNVINFEGAGTPVKQIIPQQQKAVRAPAGLVNAKSVASMGKRNLDIPLLDTVIRDELLTATVARQQQPAAEESTIRIQLFAPDNDVAGELSDKASVGKGTIAKAVPENGSTGAEPQTAEPPGTNSPGQEPKPITDIDPMIGLLDPRDLVHVVYNPEYYLQGYLKKALHLSYISKKNVLLEVESQTVVVLYAEKKVSIERSERTLYAIGRVPINGENVNISILSDELAQARGGESEVLLDWDVVLWALAARASHGRIPIGTDMTSQFYLKQLPDISRFDLDCQEKVIFELWIKQTCSLAQTLQLLDVSQQDIFSFYSKVKALGFLRQVITRKAESQYEEEPSTARSLVLEELESLVVDEENSDKQAGILKRLYSRIKG
ncbi:MAG: hypothetical protein OEY67_09110 [Gammaproteobacteria bacterium]|nr:hypothetical protein [Gammaproteobacteria bacterium]